SLEASVVVSIAMAALTFFLIGSLRSRWSPIHWLRTGTETLVIGIASAAVAFLVGDILKQII
ncbi:MAG TPA: hypothetical protein ENH27_02135, partial [Rhizobiales bacterium]|nr:hypothetical protein [Hyphomicrobiales bacterium]